MNADQAGGRLSLAWGPSDPSRVTLVRCLQMQDGKRHAKSYDMILTHLPRRL